LENKKETEGKSLSKSINGECEEKELLRFFSEGLRGTFVLKKSGFLRKISGNQYK